MITRELLQKLREGRCTAGELAALKVYFDQTDHREIEKMLGEDLDLAEQVTNPDMLKAAGEAQATIWKNLESVSSSKLPADEPSGKKRISNRWYLAAASLLVLLAALGSAWIISRSGSNQKMAAGQTSGAPWVKAVNNTGKESIVRLPDSSSVILAQGSSIQYPEGFQGKIRDVRLNGEAFFDVKKDSLHPFTIYTSMVKVRVLGTSLRVRELEGQRITEVDVRSGKVKVESNRSGKQLFLGPNQRAVAQVIDGSLTKTLVASPVMVKPVVKMQKMTFEDAPVSSVFEQLSLAYQVDIIFNEALLGDCPVTAALNDQPLFTKLDMICLSIGATYHLEGTQIIVEGEGCNQ